MNVPLAVQIPCHRVTLKVGAPPTQRINGRSAVIALPLRGVEAFDEALLRFPYPQQYSHSLGRRWVWGVCYEVQHALQVLNLFFEQTDVVPERPVRFFDHNESRYLGGRCSVQSCDLSCEVYRMLELSSDRSAQDPDIRFCTRLFGKGDVLNELHETLVLKRQRFIQQRGGPLSVERTLMI